jgi:hypothetical protein
MMYDDLAKNTQWVFLLQWNKSFVFFFRNPTKGIIINHPNGKDVYKGVPHDYIGDVRFIRPNFDCKFSSFRMSHRKTLSMYYSAKKLRCKVLVVEKLLKGTTSIYCRFLFLFC